jgi:hypothetical protein
LYLSPEFLAVTGTVSERVMPLAIQSPLELLSCWDLATFRELQLLLFQEQVKYLFDLAHVTIKSF